MPQRDISKIPLRCDDENRRKLPPLPKSSNRDLHPKNWTWFASRTYPSPKQAAASSRAYNKKYAITGDALAKAAPRLKGMPIVDNHGYNVGKGEKHLAIGKVMGSYYNPKDKSLYTIGAIKSDNSDYGKAKAAQVQEVSQSIRNRLRNKVSVRYETITDKYGRVVDYVWPELTVVASRGSKPRFDECDIFLNWDEIGDSDVVRGLQADMMKDLPSQLKSMDHSDTPLLRDLDMSGSESVGASHETQEAPRSCAQEAQMVPGGSIGSDRVSILCAVADEVAERMIGEDLHRVTILNSLDAEEGDAPAPDSAPADAPETSAPSDNALLAGIHEYLSVLSSPEEKEDKVDEPSTSSDPMDEDKPDEPTNDEPKEEAPKTLSPEQLVSLYEMVQKLTEQNSVKGSAPPPPPPPPPATNMTDETSNNNMQIDASANVAAAAANAAPSAPPVPAPTAPSAPAPAPVDNSEMDTLRAQLEKERQLRKQQEKAFGQEKAELQTYKETVQKEKADRARARATGIIQNLQASMLDSTLSELGAMDEYKKTSKERLREIAMEKINAPLEGIANLAQRAHDDDESADAVLATVEMMAKNLAEQYAAKKAAAEEQAKKEAEAKAKAAAADEEAKKKGNAQMNIKEQVMASMRTGMLAPNTSTVKMHGQGFQRTAHVNSEMDPEGGAVVGGHMDQEEEPEWKKQLNDPLFHVRERGPYNPYGNQNVDAPARIEIGAYAQTTGQKIAAAIKQQGFNETPSHYDAWNKAAQFVGQCRVATQAERSREKFRNKVFYPTAHGRVAHVNAKDIVGKTPEQVMSSLRGRIDPSQVNVDGMGVF